MSGERLVYWRLIEWVLSKIYIEAGGCLERGGTVEADRMSKIF